jgi:hypothetical protein
MPRTPDTTLQDNAAARQERLMAFVDGTSTKAKPGKAAVIRRTIAGQVIEPNIKGLGRRTASYTDKGFQPVERSTGERSISDKLMEGMKVEDAGKMLNGDLNKIKLDKAADYIGTYYMWNGILMPEYDMREPHAISDTEVYVKQAVARKLALAARAGYEIMSDREEDADYIQTRINAFEFVTERSFESFIKGVLRNLFLCSNCFLLKIRKEDASPVSKKKGGRVPVAAYVIIPAHTMHPYLEKGKISKWRRIFDHGIPWIDYPVEDIIHLKWDVKPGHIFGTPRTIAVRDDIFALRRLEENIELLFINHLFPLFHVQVGNEKAPCTYGPGGESEIDMVRFQIENMPKEGVFVTDERVTVTAVGANGKSLDFKALVEHFKSRVYIGLGMSAIDMGEGADATRATADNISQNLKDSIKADLDELADQIRMFIFKEWFQEANYSTSVQKGVARTKLAFHELDLDNRIKEETHVMALFNSHLLTETEARKRMNLKPMSKTEQNDTHFVLHVLRLEREIQKYKTASAIEIGEQDVKNQKALAGTQMKLMEAQAKLSEVKAGHEQQSLEAQAKHLPVIAKAKVAVANASSRRTSKGTGAGHPRGGTAKKTTQTAAATANKMRPTNQHGSKLGPGKNSDSLMSEIYEGLVQGRDRLIADGLNVDKNWRKASGQIIDEIVARLNQREITDSVGDSYTRQERAAGLSSLKSVIAETSDPELLSVLLRAELEDEVDDAELEYAIAGRAA